MTVPAALRLQGLGRAVRPQRAARLRACSPRRWASTRSSSPTTCSRGCTRAATPRHPSPGSARSAPARRGSLIGTSVLTPTFRYNPTVIAQDFATLGVMYPGRVILGVGTGEALNEANLGIAWPDPPERFQRLKEAIGLIQRLWSEERVNFEGTYYTTRNVTIYDKLDEPGADLHRRRRPRRDAAGRPHRRRLHHDVGQGAELYTDTLLPALHEGLEKAGRAADAIDTLMEVKVSYHPDPAAALEKTRFWAPLALSPEEKMGIDDPLEMQRLGEQLPIERAASRFIVSNDPEEHVERIARYVDLGFRHLVFHDPGARPGGVPAHVRRRDPAAAARAVRSVTRRPRSGLGGHHPGQARGDRQVAARDPRRRPGDPRPRDRARHDRGGGRLPGGGAGGRRDRRRRARRAGVRHPRAAVRLGDAARATPAGSTPAVAVGARAAGERDAARGAARRPPGTAPRRPARRRSTRRRPSSARWSPTPRAPAPRS